MVLKRMAGVRAASPSRMSTRTFFQKSLFLVVPILFGAFLSAAADAEKEKKDPRLMSLFPLGGQQGSSFEITIRGENLPGVRRVWFDCGELSAEIKAVKEMVLEKTRFSTRLQTPGQEVRIAIHASQDAAIGAHSLRLLTEGGISGSLSVLVTSEPLLAEQSEAHYTATTAQAVSFPARINGRISRDGELDYYSFEALEGQELSFEALVAGGILPGAPVQFLDPELILYNPAGSWFDPHKAIRLETEDESTFLRLTESRILRPRLRYRFRNAGRYLVVLGSLSQKGGPGHGYQLRIAPVDGHSSRGETAPTDLKPAHPTPLPPWRERIFTRTLNQDRYRQLSARTLTPAGDCCHQVLERQSAAGAEQVVPISIPALLEGRIGRPGDVDLFSFRAEAGQKLAFEIETPQRMPPDFNPWLELLDSEGQPVCSNLYRMVENNSAYWLKFLQPKTVFSIAEAGNYVLRIGDLTSQLGGSDFIYRLLIRPQLPHVGEMTLKGNDHVNLIAGEAKKVTVNINQEEGFQHLVTLSAGNLPPGVRAVPIVPESKPPSPAKGPRGEVHSERFFPETRKIELTLVADPAVRPTDEPQEVTLTARVLAEGRPGEPIPVQSLYLTITGPNRSELTGRLALGE